MVKTLYAKFAGLLLIVSSLIGIGYLALTLESTQLHLQEVNQRLHRDLAKRLVSEEILIQGSQVSNQALEELFHQLMVINPAIEAYLLEPTGKIRAYSAPPGEVELREVDLEPILNSLSSDSSWPILGDNPREPGQQVLFSASPVPLTGRPEAYLYLVLSGEQYRSAVEMMQENLGLQLSIIVGAGALLLSVGAGLLSFRIVTRRLSLLTGEMKDYSNSNFTRTKGLTGEMFPEKGDEIDILNSTFRGMKRRIQQQIQDLREKEESRRELLAALSHDLRTPLATLRSHIETLCEKGETLSAGDRRHLLEVADRSGKNLSHLVSQLFELAQLDSGDTQPQTEKFSLAELVQDTVQEFQLAAASRGISLKAEIDTTLPETEGDIGLIQRVLVNLLENSLRVTGDGGKVQISLRGDEQKDLLKVSVSDNGPGIAPDKLPFIFERPHRVKSRIGRSDHAGLGLITVKRILDLHKQPIEIESKLGEGTRVTFKLPVVSTVQ